MGVISKETLFKVAAQPYAGAVKTLRHYDPMWQAEIGEERAWDIELEKPCGCDCPHCEPDWKRIVVEATTWAAAFAAADTECHDGWAAERLRPEGSSSDYVDRFDLEEAW